MLPPFGGGAEVVAEVEAKQLQEAGNEVFLVSTTQGVGGAIVIPHHNIFSPEKLGSHSFLARLLWHSIHIFNFRTARDIQKILLREKPDVVYTHNVTGLGFLIPRMIKKLGIAHTHTLHDVQLINPSGVMAWNHTRDSFFEKLYSFATRRLFGSPDVVTAPSQFLLDLYRSRQFFPKSQLVHKKNPQIFAPQVKNLAHSGPTRFLFVGSLTEHKGCGFLLSVWETYTKDFSSTLTIVGSGPLQNEVEKLAANDNRVSYLGSLHGAALQAVYANADIFLFPSLCIENSPRVIDEALAHGLFVLASRTGGVPELLKDKRCGKLIEPGNIVGWKEAMVTTTQK